MKAKYNPIKRLNYVLIASICVGEAFIMYLLPFFGPISSLAAIVLDVALLTLITIPVLQLLVVKPMKKRMHDLEFAEETIVAREDQMLAVLNALAEAKDNDTGSHIVRTQKYVSLLANRLKMMGEFPDILTEGHIEKLVKVAPLHDIGKVGIPDHVLNKRGRLTDEERELMSHHPLIGESILAVSQSEEVEMELISTAIKLLALIMKNGMELATLDI